MTTLKRRHAEKIQHRLIQNTFGSHAAVGMSHVMGYLAGIPLPPIVLNAVIKIYSRTMGVNTGEYETPDTGFRCFNEFFGRRLRPGSRPLIEADDDLVSPCDGAVVAKGPIHREVDAQFHIKGFTYTLSALLGTDDDNVQGYAGGEYLVFYLHPRDYHRVHVPARGFLRSVRHLPGKRFPVTNWCESRVPGIYVKNERMVFDIELPNQKRLSVVMVAAFGVGNIDIPFDPGFGTGERVRRFRQFEPPPRVSAGDDLGAFLLGSTVVLVWSPGAVELDDALDLGPISMGTRIGKSSALIDSRT